MGKHKDHKKKKDHKDRKDRKDHKKHKDHKDRKHDGHKKEGDHRHHDEKKGTLQMLGVNRPAIMAPETKVNGKNKGANYQQVPMHTNPAQAQQFQTPAPVNTQQIQTQAPAQSPNSVQTQPLGPYGPYNPQTIALQATPTDGVWAGAGTAFPSVSAQPNGVVPINGELPIGGVETSSRNNIEWKEVKVHRGRRRYKVPCLKGAYYNAHHWFPYPFYAKKDCAGSSYSGSSSSSSSSSWY